MPFGGDISLTYLCNIYEWELGSRGKHIFKTTFMKCIQFCILTENEKENSNQIYQTRTQTIHLIIISSKCCVLIILMEEIFPKENDN